MDQLSITALCKEIPANFVMVIDVHQLEDGQQVYCKMGPMPAKVFAKLYPESCGLLPKVFIFHRGCWPGVKFLMPPWPEEQTYSIEDSVAVIYTGSVM